MKKKPLRQEEIQDLINSNETLKIGYEEFKKKYPRRRIYEMLTYSYLTERYPDKVYIKFEINNKIETFYYEVK